MKRPLVTHSAGPRKEMPKAAAGVLLNAMVVALFASALPAAADDGGAETSFDGLRPIPNARVSKAYIDPTADFSIYERVRILEPYVAFRRNWKRDQDRNRTRRLTPSDIERIKSEVAKLFEEVFRKELERKNGYEVVDSNGPDVLLLRPAIIDLDITAPDTLDDARSDTYTTSAGSATLYLELFDSESGEIIGRAADHETVRGPANTVTIANRASNSAEARRMFRRWARLLREFLDRHYTPANR